MGETICPVCGGSMRVTHPTGGIWCGHCRVWSNSERPRVPAPEPDARECPWYVLGFACLRFSDGEVAPGPGKLAPCACPYEKSPANRADCHVRALQEAAVPHDPPFRTPAETAATDPEPTLRWTMPDELEARGRITAEELDFFGKGDDGEAHELRIVRWACSKAAATIRALEQELADAQSERDTAEKIATEDIAKCKQAEQERDALASQLHEVGCELDRVRPVAEAALELGAAAEQRAVKAETDLAAFLPEGSDTFCDDCGRPMKRRVQGDDPRCDLCEARIELSALQAETADLREIARCKASIEAAGCQWSCNSAREPRRSVAWAADNTGWRSVGEDGRGETIEAWRQAEREVWKHAADKHRYRARIEQAGYWLELCYMRIGQSAVRLYRQGEHHVCRGCGGQDKSPTLPALEEAATWAEAQAAKPTPCPACGQPRREAE